MGRFRKERFRTSDTKEEFDIFHPTVMKKGSVVIAGRENTFVRKIKKRR